MTLSAAEQQVLNLLQLETAVTPPPVPPALAAGVERLALENEVACTIALNLTDAAAETAVPPSWQVAYAETEIRISAYLAELDQVAAHLAGHGIPLAALKNGGIARGIYPHPGAVPMGDLDVLVDPRHFLRAHELLLEMDYTLTFRSDQLEDDLAAALQEGGAEYVKTLPGGHELWLELQWRPVSGRWIRPDQEPVAADLLARSLPIPGSDVRLLAPADNLLQVCLHTAKHSYVRPPGLRLHLDVARIVRAYPELDWTAVAKQARALQVQTAVYFALVLPQELLGVPVPAAVLEALRPPAWKEQRLRTMITSAGLFQPRARQFSRSAYIFFNVLLYDDGRGLWRGVFPERDWMQRKYEFSSPLLLPYYHARRLADLLFRRLAT